MLTSRLYTYQDKITEKITEIDRAQSKTETSERRVNHLTGDLQSVEDQRRKNEVDLAEKKTVLEKK